MPTSVISTLQGEHVSHGRFPSVGARHVFVCVVSYVYLAIDLHEPLCALAPPPPPRHLAVTSPPPHSSRTTTANQTTSTSTSTSCTGSVVYATIFQAPPPLEFSVDTPSSQLFARARRMLPPNEGGSGGKLPTRDERLFLRHVATHVALGHALDLSLVPRRTPPPAQPVLTTGRSSGKEAGAEGDKLVGTVKYAFAGAFAVSGLVAWVIICGGVRDWLAAARRSSARLGSGTLRNLPG